MNSTRPEPRLTVLLTTFNHADYVRRSVESILGQRMDEAFDIIVADDGSSDDTVQTLRGYAEANPHIGFTFLDASSNLGVTRNYQRAFAACRSEYVAIMEGDDYWCSPHKLARQLEFLDAHWECDVCGVNYYVFHEAACRFTLREPKTAGHTVYTARDLIADNIVSNFSTCMYRRSALVRLPDRFFDIRSYDWAANICVGRYSLIGFLREPMSVYRVHTGGAWNRLSDTERLESQLALIPEYDALTDGVFHSEFRALAGRLKRAIARSRIAHGSAPSREAPATAASSLADLIPPIVVTAARLLLPPALTRSLVDRGIWRRGE